MAFLDNSGDIILDAVLTDTGRFRLAKGDGSFKIAKFAFGDDEIDYGLYRNTNHANGAHSSGSAYYDLSILQTPVLEAFTNNTSTMKTKLISINRTNLLYLPMLKINDTMTRTNRNDQSLQASGSYVIAVDKDTETNMATNASKGVIKGANFSADGTYIQVDQGLDTTEIPALFALDSDLVERQYIIEIDNRLGKIASPTDGTLAKVSFVDDDSIASYYLSQGTNPAYVKDDWSFPGGDLTDGTSSQYVIAGPKGTYLRFTILSSLELQTSTNMFSKVGGTAYTWGTDAGGAGSNTVDFIDSTVRITGATTGYQIDVPIRFVKCSTC